jgi:hypothetical protein
MSAAEVLGAAWAAGVDIAVDGDDLLLNAPMRPAAALLVELRRKKAEIVSMLRRSAVISSKPAHQASVAGAPAAVEEGAASVEVGAGVPGVWAEGFARLNVTTRPKGFTQADWEQILATVAGSWTAAGQTVLPYWDGQQRMSSECIRSLRTPATTPWGSFCSFAAAMSSTSRPTAPSSGTRRVTASSTTFAETVPRRSPSGDSPPAHRGLRGRGA